MTTPALILIACISLFFVIRKAGGKTTWLKNFSWLWWIFEIEVLFVVIGSLFILILITGTTALRHHFFSDSRTELELITIKDELEEYYANHSQYPVEIDQVIRNNPLKRTWLKDDWDNPYVFTFRTNYFEIRSAGADGRYGNEDDLTITNENQLPTKPKTN